MPRLELFQTSCMVSCDVWNHSAVPILDILRDACEGVEDIDMETVVFEHVLTETRPGTGDVHLTIRGRAGRMSSRQVRSPFIQADGRAGMIVETVGEREARMRNRHVSAIYNPEGPVAPALDPEPHPNCRCDPPFAAIDRHMADTIIERRMAAARRPPDRVSYDVETVPAPGITINIDTADLERRLVESIGLLEEQIIRGSGVGIPSGLLVEAGRQEERSISLNRLRQSMGRVHRGPTATGRFSSGLDRIRQHVNMGPATRERFAGLEFLVHDEVAPAMSLSELARIYGPERAAEARVRNKNYAPEVRDERGEL